MRNALKGRLVYDLPFGKGRMFMNKSWFLDEILGQWQLASTMQFQSGQPFTVSVNNVANYQLAGSVFPNWNGGKFYPNTKTIDHWFDPSAFTLPAPGTFGNLRRNALYGPGYENVDISAGKRFDIHEQMRLQFRIDTVNAFNHTNYGLPGGSGFAGLNADSGQLPGTSFSAGAAGNNQIRSLQGGGRTVQLAARFEF